MFVSDGDWLSQWGVAGQRGARLMPCDGRAGRQREETDAITAAL